jgi:hypothetical protein
MLQGILCIIKVVLLESILNAKLFLQLVSNNSRQPDGHIYCDE